MSDLYGIGNNGILVFLERCPVHTLSIPQNTLFMHCNVK